jgi:hypothetical protein
MLPGGRPAGSGKLRKDRAGGFDFPGFPGLVAILIAAFMIAVIVW